MEVSLNEIPSTIVDLTVKQTGFYWAPVDKLTFALPSEQSQGTFTVTITGLQNPYYWNSSFNSSDITLTYLHSGLSTIAIASYSFNTSITLDKLEPLTVYSENPFIG